MDENNTYDDSYLLERIREIEEGLWLIQKLLLVGKKVSINAHYGYARGEGVLAYTGVVIDMQWGDAVIKTEDGLERTVSLNKVDLT